MASVVAAGCKGREAGKLDPIRAIRARVEPRFRPPADGRMTGAQVDAYVKVRRAVGSTRSDTRAARELGIDPAEFDWIRARMIEAFGLLDSRAVHEAALESAARAVAALRAARRSALDARTAARLDAEITAAERERAAMRRFDAATPAVVANAALLAPRRAELEALGP